MHRCDFGELNFHSEVNVTPAPPPPPPTPPTSPPPLIFRQLLSIYDRPPCKRPRLINMKQDWNPGRRDESEISKPLTPLGP